MSKPLMVLNVNDDAATRYLMSRILRGGGYEVVEAVDGASALRELAIHAPELVLLDIKLPDMSGLEVCRRIKSDPKTSTVLVIQTSATFSSSDRKVAGLDSGADAYLAQPIEAVELLATVRAVLRSRRAEEAERKAARRLHRTFDAIQDALLLIDVQGNIEECNGAAARLLGTTAAHLAGRSCIGSLRRLIPHEIIETLLARSRVARHELEATSQGRSYRLSGYPVHGEDGTSEGVVLLIADISDRKRLESELHARVQELAESARRKDEFLGMLAHELRNPLHAISAASNVLERTATPALSRPRDVIHRQLTVLARLVDDLLEVSRMTHGAIQLRKRTIDLGQIVRQAAQGSGSVFEGRKQQLTLSIPDEPFVIEGDDLRLEQVVMNLLANASKFSEPGSAINLELRERWDADQRIAELIVRDPGIGIPREMLGKIFDHFVQVDQSLARSLGGLGIGLSMAKSLVELHGGSIIAKSEGVGKGAEFVVHLPAKPADQPLESPARTTSVPPAREGESKHDGALRVLVVEDNEDTLELVQMWLRNLGHTVEGASDGASGLETAITMKPDVALVDIGLPGIDGYEVARSVRAAEGGGQIYMVAVTGYGRPEDRARALDSGFDAYIVKPLDVAGLKRALEPRNIAQRKNPRDRLSDAPAARG
jgi:PAS domain S-box-containing protein